MGWRLIAPLKGLGVNAVRTPQFEVIGDDSGPAKRPAVEKGNPHAPRGGFQLGIDMDSKQPLSEVVEIGAAGIVERDEAGVK